MTRVLTAIVLLSIAWPVTELGSPLAFLLLAGVLIVLGTWECYRLLEALGWRPFKPVGLIAVALVTWTFSELGNPIDPIAPIVLATVVTPILMFWRRADTRQMAHSTVATLFPIFFVGVTLGHVVRLRELAGEDGRDLVYLLFVCVFFADTAAYYVGTLLGRHRMAPRISPKKSWEGAAGGIAASIGGALLGHFWFYQRLGLGEAIVVGALLGFVGILGDLAESMLKRGADVKDSSAVLPGHGGILDRFDSVLFAAPVLYYVYVWFLRP